jgi:hypothetical protein
MTNLHRRFQIIENMLEENQQGFFLTSRLTFELNFLHPNFIDEIGLS